MRFSPRDRVLVLAPHPDDETLGAGGFIQRAAASGASCRVVFVTDGDNNPWPQRVVERRLRIDAEARARWGARRRAEAYEALDALGIPRACAVFLGFPDQGLTRLLVNAPADVIRRLGTELLDWRPTMVVMPSLRDRHPDHSAVAVLALATLAALPVGEQPLMLTYTVHPFDTTSSAGSVRLHLTRDEQARKRVAIERHRTQLVFHRRAYRRAAAPVESLATISAPLRACTGTGVEYASADTGAVVHMRLAARFLVRPAVLFVVGWDTTMRHVALSADLFPARRTLRVRDGRSGTVLGSALLASAGDGIRIDVPLPRPIVLARLFVKLAMRSTFFDSDGWIEGVVPRDAASPEVRCAVR